MKKELAFVLSGGGSRGALQVGALRALLEAGYKPALVTGTSIGSVNAAFMAVHGFNLESIQELEKAWKATTSEDLLPTNLWWQTMQTLFGRNRGVNPQQRIREFAIQYGIKPELRFKDIQGVRLFIVATDLNSAGPVIFGENPEDSVLDGMLASAALPPWMSPLEKEGRYLLDGGAVSNLPIEAALHQGAEEIIALNLLNPYEIDDSEHGLRPFLWKLNNAVENRQLFLEMELAEARGVKVRQIQLIMENPVSFWDFRQSVELIELGYQITTRAINDWQMEEQAAGRTSNGLRAILENLFHWKRD